MGKNKNFGKIPDQNKSAEDLKKAVSFLKANGIPSFILLFRPVEGITTFHAEDVRMKAAIEMVMAGFQQILKSELEMHPEYSPEYRQIFADLLQDFQNIIKNANQRFASFQAGPDVPRA